MSTNTTDVLPCHDLDALVAGASPGLGEVDSGSAVAVTGFSPHRRPSLPWTFWAWFAIVPAGALVLAWIVLQVIRGLLWLDRWWWEVQ